MPTELQLIVALSQQAMKLARQKALLLMPRTAKDASTSSEELNAQLSLPTDDGEPNHEDQLQNHQKTTQWWWWLEKYYWVDSESAQSTAVAAGYHFST